MRKEHPRYGFVEKIKCKSRNASARYVYRVLEKRVWSIKASGLLGETGSRQPPASERLSEDYGCPRASGEAGDLTASTTSICIPLSAWTGIASMSWSSNPLPSAQEMWELCQPTQVQR